MRYADIIGNENIKRTLISMGKTGRFPSTIIIEGAAGSGRSSMAMAAAGTMLCGDGEYRARHGEGCGVCMSCRKSREGINPDLEIYGEGEGGANSFHVETVRELSGSIYLTPTENERRVIILKDIQKMTPQAQNALLKSIEEPPARVNFIITAETSWGILETVKSRAAVLCTEYLSGGKIERYLREKYGDDERIRSAVKLAGGTIGAAKEYLAGSEGFEAYEYVYESVKKCLRGGAEAAGEKCALMQKNYKKNETVAYIEAYETALRDILLYKTLINVKNEEYIGERMEFFGDIGEAEEYRNKYSADSVRELLNTAGKYRWNCGYNVSVKLNFTAFLAGI